MTTSDSGSAPVAAPTALTSAPAPDQSSQAAPEPIGKGTWYEGIDRNIYDDPSLMPLKGEDGGINAHNLLKSYVHAQKSIGRDKVIVPGPNDGPEAWNEVFQKLGLPQQKNDYLREIPGLEVADQNLFNSFKEKAFELGILPKQAAEILKWNAQMQAQQQEETQRTVQMTQSQTIETLKQEWGQTFEPKLGQAKAALEAFGDPDIVNFLNETRLGDDPIIIKFFAKLGESMIDDAIKGEPQDPYGGRLTPSQAQERINDIMADMTHPYFHKDSPKHESSVAEMQKYFQMLGER